MPGARDVAVALVLAAIVLSAAQMAAWGGAPGAGDAASRDQLGASMPFDPAVPPSALRVPPVAEPPPPPASEPVPPPPPPRFASVPLRLGSDLEGMRAGLARGEAPDYVLLWAGAWNWKGMDDLRRELTEAREANVTPVVEWYFWGEDISPAAVEQGVWSSQHGAWKNRDWWTYLAGRLAALLHEVMQGREVLVVLESEFNKNGIEHHEAFDGDLAAQAALFRQAAPEARIVLGFGNWGRDLWDNFDRAAAASDYVGFQTLRASTRHAPEGYHAADEEVEAAVDTAQRSFNKPSMLVDFGLSTFDGRAEAQAEALQALLERAPALHARGLAGVVYRAWRDAPDHGDALWFGPAEAHWGLVDAAGEPKPAEAVWLDAMAARTAR